MRDFKGAVSKMSKYLVSFLLFGVVNFVVAADFILGQKVEKKPEVDIYFLYFLENIKSAPKFSKIHFSLCLNTEVSDELPVRIDHMYEKFGVSSLESNGVVEGKFTRHSMAINKEFLGSDGGLLISIGLDENASKSTTYISIDVENLLKKKGIEKFKSKKYDDVKICKLSKKLPASYYKYFFRTSSH